MIKKIIIFIFSIFFLSQTISYAETIILKSGKTVEGNLIEKTDKYIKIDFQSVPITYFFDEIDTINGQKLYPAIVTNELPVSYGQPEPKREKGLSAHFSPKSAAEVLGAGKNGFMVSQAKNLQPTLERPVFDTPGKLVEYFLNQPQEIRENGLWVITTNPKAYSTDEIESTEVLKDLCRQKKIPLFFCRGMDLPNGWLEADKFNLAKSDDIINAREIENKANTADLREDYNEAVELYNQALKVTPNPAYVIHDRGMAYLHKGEFDKAISDISKAMEMSPNEKDFIAQCYNDRGNAYYDSGQYEKSWQDVQKAIESGYKVHPGFIAALKNKGYSK